MDIDVKDNEAMSQTVATPIVRSGDDVTIHKCKGKPIVLGQGSFGMVLQGWSEDYEEVAALKFFTDKGKANISDMDKFSYEEAAIWKV